MVYNWASDSTIPLADNTRAVAVRIFRFGVKTNVGT